MAANIQCSSSASLSSHAASNRAGWTNEPDNFGLQRQPSNDLHMTTGFQRNFRQNSSGDGLDNNTQNTNKSSRSSLFKKNPNRSGSIISIGSFKKRKNQPAQKTIARSIETRAPGVETVPAPMIPNLHITDNVIHNAQTGKVYDSKSGKPYNSVQQQNLELIRNRQNTLQHQQSIPASHYATQARQSEIQSIQLAQNHIPGNMTGTDLSYRAKPLLKKHYSETAPSNNIQTTQFNSNTMPSNSIYQNGNVNINQHQNSMDQSVPNRGLVQSQGGPQSGNMVKSYPPRASENSNSQLNSHRQHKYSVSSATSRVSGTSITTQNAMQIPMLTSRILLGFSQDANRVHQTTYNPTKLNSVDLPPTKPKFIRILEPKINITGTINKKQSIQVTIIGFPEPEIEWFKDETQICKGVQILSSKIFCLGSGVYKCVAKNKHGEDSTSSIITYKLRDPNKSRTTSRVSSGTNLTSGTITTSKTQGQQPQHKIQSAKNQLPAQPRLGLIQSPMKRITTPTAVVAPTPVTPQAFKGENNSSEVDEDPILESVVKLAERSNNQHHNQQRPASRNETNAYGGKVDKLKNKYNSYNTSFETSSRTSTPSQLRKSKEHILENREQSPKIKTRETPSTRQIESRAATSTAFNSAVTARSNLSQVARTHQETLNKCREQADLDKQQVDKSKMFETRTVKPVVFKKQGSSGFNTVELKANTKSEIIGSISPDQSNGTGKDHWEKILEKRLETDTCSMISSGKWHGRTRANRTRRNSTGSQISETTSFFTATEGDTVVASDSGLGA